MTTALDVPAIYAEWNRIRQEQHAPKPDPTQDYPAPEVTSDDPWPVDFSAPRAVATLRAFAESHGWAVGVTYSRGSAPHGATGQPLAVAHHVVLRMLHPDSKARCIAHYVVRLDGGAKKWDGFLIVSPSTHLYAGCTLEQVREWIAASGRTLPGWLDAVKRTNLIRTRADKVWELYARDGCTVGQIAADLELDKQTVMEIITRCRAEGRAVPSKAKSSRKRTEAGG